MKLKFTSGRRLSRALFAAGLVAASVGGVGSARAFTTIANPDANYLASTTKLTIGGAAGSGLTSLTNGSLTASFSDSRTVAVVPSS